AIHAGQEVSAEGALRPLSELLDDEAAYRDSLDFRRDEEFWQQRFSQPPELTNLSGRPHATPRGYLRRSVLLPSAVLEQVTSVAWQARVTWQVFVIAAVAAYTRRLTGYSDVL